jgi:hypothetical protein
LPACCRSMLPCTPRPRSLFSSCWIDPQLDPDGSAIGPGSLLLKLPSAQAVSSRPMAPAANSPSALNLPRATNVSLDPRIRSQDAQTPIAFNRLERQCGGHAPLLRLAIGSAMIPRQGTHVSRNRHARTEHQPPPPTEAVAAVVACERLADQGALVLALAVFFAVLLAVSDGAASAVTGAVFTEEQRAWNSALALVSWSALPRSA